MSVPRVPCESFPSSQVGLETRRWNRIEELVLHAEEAKSLDHSSAKFANLVHRVDQGDCLSDWRSRKPSQRRHPLKWARRKVRLILGDLLRPLGLRVVEQVDFSILRRSIQASHILDVGVAGGTPSLYARFPGAQLDLFEPARAHFPVIEQRVVSKRAARLHPVALADKSGFGVLSRAGRSGATLLPTVSDGSTSPNGQPVVIRRLDSMNEDKQRHQAGHAC